MFGLFQAKPLLDEDSVAWIFESYAWALRHFDRDLLLRETPLVTPSNAHFPGREDSLEGMARLIFDQVARHAGMAHWPWQLIDQTGTGAEPVSPSERPGYRRGVDLPPVADDAPRLPVSYHPQLVANPEALIANYAQSLGHYLALSAQEPPPASAEQWPILSELLGVFMGFGLMFANSAFAFRGGCGRCKTAIRTAYLSQDEATYALALFCVLKDIPQPQVFAHLKKHLKPVYKKAVKDICQRESALSLLRAAQA